MAAAYSNFMGWTGVVFHLKMLVAFIAIIACAESERIFEDRFSSEQHNRGLEMVKFLILQSDFY
jgi:hypothetical protein